MGKLSAGIVFGSLVLAGVSIMISLPLEAGASVIAIALIWALLAFPRWGPLRKRWESSPTKILSIEVGDYAFGSPGKHGFPQAINDKSLLLRIHVAFQAMPTMRVESVHLEIKGKIKGKQLPTAWEPDHINVGITYSIYIYFEVPKWVKVGKHKVKLVAFADGKHWSSRISTIEFPKQN